MPMESVIISKEFAAPFPALSDRGSPNTVAYLLAHFLPKSETKNRADKNDARQQHD